MRRRAVITGLGIIAPNGIGKDTYWEATIEGKSGIGTISRFDASNYRTRIAGEVNDFDPTQYMSKKESRRMSRCTQFALAASQMAVEDAQLEITEENSYRVGIALGTAIGGLEIAEEQCRIFHKRGRAGISPLAAAAMNPNAAVGAVATRLGIRGPNISVSTGCSAGLSAIGYALDAIRYGKVESIIAGGMDAPLSPVTFSSFDATHTLSTRNDSPQKASRPFDDLRDGYILGEGSGIVIMEEMEHALRRGANIYAEVAGYGITNDAYDLNRVDPDGKNAAKTMELALEDAGLDKEEVDYINAHGSSSRLTDKKETKAIKMALGQYARRTFISSIKSMIGQPLAATGGIQLITAILAIKKKCLPPTINYEYPDPDCDLDYIPNQARDEKAKVALVNAFGMGGSNVSTVVKEFNGNGICKAILVERTRERRYDNIN
ncbi:MAG: beta-ketoacyl-ACP synthase II [Nitrospirae bacterium]|nr:beta-ketoacyl-ACP synthase II [Nitrospirota bacterium]